jgi:hypothetical protein
VRALNWCRRALARVVPITSPRIALFCVVRRLRSGTVTITATMEETSGTATVR